MKSYLAGSDLTLLIDLVDTAGNALSVDSIDYRILNELDTELLASTSLAEFVANDATASVMVPAGLNTLERGALRAARVVELRCVMGGGTTIVRHVYALEADSVLAVGGNSFQTYAQAELLSLTMPEMTGWESASEQSRIAALIEARRRICRLSFINIYEYSQNHLNVPSELTAAIYGASDPWGLDCLTVAEFNALSQRFRNALALAQVTEANAILGGDPADTRRQEGLVMDVVGDSRQQWRAGKPLDLPICKAAMRYLSGFVRLSASLGRT